MKGYKAIAVISALILSIGCLCGCVNGAPGQKTSDSADGGAAKIMNVDVTIKTVDAASRVETELVPAKSFKKVIADIRPSVVEILALSPSEDGESITTFASGVVIASGASGAEESGSSALEASAVETESISFIATCYHIVEKAPVISVVDVYGNEYTATPVGADDRTDIIVLSVKGNLPAVTFLSDPTSLGVGECVFAAGNPLGTPGGTITKGILSAINYDIVVNNLKTDLMQTDAATGSGSSGGGLFTDDRYFIGLINDKYADYIDEKVSGISFVTPSDTVSEISQELMETYTGERLGYIRGRYLLGCTVANHYTTYWQSSSYVVINTIDEKGSFYKGGLRAGDQIVSVAYGGVVTTVTTAVRFSEYLDSLELKVGDELTFNIKRGEYFNTLAVPILQYVCGEK